MLRMLSSSCMPVVDAADQEKLLCDVSESTESLIFERKISQSTSSILSLSGSKGISEQRSSLRWFSGHPGAPRSGTFIWAVARFRSVPHQFDVNLTCMVFPGVKLAFLVHLNHDNNDSMARRFLRAGSWTVAG